MVFVISGRPLKCGAAGSGLDESGRYTRAAVIGCLRSFPQSPRILNFEHGGDREGGCPTVGLLALQKGSGSKQYGSKGALETGKVERVGERVKEE
jgi:hypothetical protein